MLTDRQQVFETRSAWNRTVLLCLSGLIFVLQACESPPRPNKWQDRPLTEQPAHSSDQTAPAVLSPNRSSKRSQTLRIHMNADPGSLNPMATPSVWTSRIMLDTVFETLLRYQPAVGAGPGVYAAGLARSWTVSPSGRELRFQLQPKAKFQDGKGVTALDVQFSLEAAMTKRGHAPHHRLALADVAAVEIVSRDQVRVRLHKSNAFVLRELATVPILPEHLYRKRLTQSGPWIGSGPYRLESEGEDLILSRDPGYWGSAPSIETIHFARHQDAAFALREAKEGQMDIIPELIAEHYPENYPGAQAGAAMALNFAALELQPAQFSYLLLNTSAPPFDDVNVRRAISHVVDVEASVVASGGLTRRVGGPIWPGGPGDGAAPAPPVQSLAEGAQLLQLAGWRDDDGDGVRARSGQRLMITVLVSEKKETLRDATLNALRKAGFVLDIRRGSAAVLKNRLRTGDFDLAFSSWNGNFDRDLSTLLSSTSKQNYGRFQSASIDALLLQIQSSWEPANRAPLLGKLAEALRRSMPIVALSAPQPRGLVHKRVQGLRVWNGWFALRDVSLRAEAE